MTTNQTYDLFNPPKEKSFFNTISLKGEELKEADNTCKTQEKRILAIFQEKGKLTPSMVETIYNGLYAPTPLTSIRRSTTNLTTNGNLIKLDEMAMGKYNKPEHFWQIVLKKDIEFL